MSAFIGAKCCVCDGPLSVPWAQYHQVGGGEWRHAYAEDCRSYLSVRAVVAAWRFTPKPRSIW